MKKISLILIACCLWLAGQAQTSVYTVDNVPKVRLQDKTKYVSNPDGILSRQATDSIDRMLYALEEKTGIETAVIVVPSIGSEECFDFAYNLGSKWGVGKKKHDNGLVILLVTDQRCIQIVTGYGLEGDLPDAIAKRIQTQYMIPYFREGNWDAGMVAGIKAICARLDGSMPNDKKEENALGNFLMVFLSIIGILILSALASAWKVWKSKKCPNCGKHKLMRTDSHLVSRKNGIKTEDVVYTCGNCGHRVVRRKQSYDENYRGGGGGGPFIGGFGGGFFGGGRGGGGGFGGGSFGGGGFGGGGAGSRF